MPEERKLVTILFADVTGSTALYMALDAYATYAHVLGAHEEALAATRRCLQWPNLPAWARANALNMIVTAHSYRLTTTPASQRRGRHWRRCVPETPSVSWPMRWAMPRLLSTSAAAGRSSSGCVRRRP
jgi:hypothetical protein